ncbi:MAG: hypothetical protein JO063_08235 [Pseudonocardiales bacterium]|nr:hypothetical protein [Pseudonocardiales bacterium]MBW0010090.1 hypothetical protein [Pseudonocardiales bacterium]
MAWRAGCGAEAGDAQPAAGRGSSRAAPCADRVGDLVHKSATQVDELGAGHPQGLLAQLLIAVGPGIGERHPGHGRRFRVDRHHQPTGEQPGERARDVARYPMAVLQPTVTHLRHPTAADPAQRDPLVHLSTGQRGRVGRHPALLRRGG